VNELARIVACIPEINWSIVGRSGRTNGACDELVEVKCVDGELQARVMRRDLPSAVLCLSSEDAVVAIRRARKAAADMADGVRKIQESRENEGSRAGREGLD